MTIEWKPLSAQEDKVTERDWKLLIKAQKYENTNLRKAISIYEGFVSEAAKYPLPYLRLPIIYRKQKAYSDEIRVLKIAIAVFERDDDQRNLSEARLRLEKAVALAEKQIV